MVTKSELAKRELSQQFFLKQTERKYILLVWGEPNDVGGRIDNFLARDKKIE